MPSSAPTAVPAPLVDNSPASATHQLFAIEFTAEISWADLTRLRKETGVPNLGHLNSPATRPVAGTLLECGSWGEAWLTMVQLGETAWRIVATSDRDHSPDFGTHLALAHKMVKVFNGDIDRVLT